MQVTRLTNQSIFDLSIQYTGSVESFFEAAVKNNISVSFVANEALGLLESVVVPEVTNKQVVDYFKTNKLFPATGFDNYDIGGIGDMAIEVDFIVR